MKTIEQAFAAYGAKMIFAPLHEWPCDQLDMSNSTALSFVERTVWAEPTAPIEEIFHELMHIVFAVPGLEIEETPEDIVLLQAERAIGWHVSECRRAWGDLIAFQANTTAPLVHNLDGASLGRRLGSVGFERKRGWREGFVLARRLGVIDDARRPTWRRPRWSEALKKHCRTLSERTAL